MRLACFNVESLDDTDDAAMPLERRVSILRALLARIDADVLCLQEVHGQRDATGEPRRLRALDHLLADTTYATFHRAATGSDDRPGVLSVHNMVTLSRFPVASARSIRHLHVAPPSWQPRDRLEPESIEWDRPFLGATIELPGGRLLHVVNVHLRAPLASFVPDQKSGPFEWKSTRGWAQGFFVSSLKRVGQAYEVRLHVDNLLDADPGALIVVAGDFNADVREMPVRVIRADAGDTGNEQLANRSLFALEEGLAAAARYSVVHGGRRMMLDHLLVSAPLAGANKSIEVLNDDLPDEADPAADNDPRSHHAPIVATFALEP